MIRADRVPSTPPLNTSRLTLAELIERERIQSKIESIVARLIDALNAIDGPAEDLEPSLAGFCTTPFTLLDAEEDAGDQGELDDEGDVLDLGELDDGCALGAAA